MYFYRQLSAEEKQEVVRTRRLRQHPWHEPPHPGSGQHLYILTAACFEHQPILHTSARRAEWAKLLVGGIENELKSEIRAWVVLPNHWHLLARLDLEDFTPWIKRLYNRTSTRWNGEDDKRGRRVWFRYTDQKIRGSEHYFRALNYIHYNPVKHGYVTNASDSPHSSLSVYKEQIGSAKLNQWWVQYPPDRMGEGWDAG